MQLCLPYRNQNMPPAGKDVIDMKKDATLFTAGGIVYPMLEILCRGKTDVSMAFAGGVCLCLIDRVCNRDLKAMPLTAKCFAGSAIITTVEFATGVLVNLVFKQDGWDYSDLPLNVMGQICLPFSLLWFLLTIPAMGLCMLCEKFQPCEPLRIRVPRNRKTSGPAARRHARELRRPLPKFLDTIYLK